MADLFNNFTVDPTVDAGNVSHKLSTPIRFGNTAINKVLDDAYKMDLIDDYDILRRCLGACNNLSPIDAMDAISNAVTERMAELSTSFPCENNYVADKHKANSYIEKLEKVYKRIS